MLNTVDATSVTEKLLEQVPVAGAGAAVPPGAAAQSNEDLAEQAELLADKNSEVEAKYQEVEEAKRLVEEKASELSVSSKYKSEFIANMSHELRTPLNSLLVLAEQLEDNPDGNLTDRQVEYAHVIRSSGGDLLKLLNDILDLAKVESNTVALEIKEVLAGRTARGMLQTFGSRCGGARAWSSRSSWMSALPATMMTDSHRLRQVLKNLLANAFKFTEDGKVAAASGTERRRLVTGRSGRLDRADSVIAISVTDTGIGIRERPPAAIFEAFAQVDGTTARQYGGTGLGLSISRNLVEPARRRDHARRASSARAAPSPSSCRSSQRRTRSLQAHQLHWPCRLRSKPWRPPRAQGRPPGPARWSPRPKQMVIPRTKMKPRVGLRARQS